MIFSTDGNPIGFVNIMLKGTTRGETSSDDGRYSIKNVKEGHYTLIATYVGLQAQEIINQYELSVKNKLFNGLLSANVTVYNIINRKQAQAVLANDIPADTEEIKYNRANPQELGCTTASKVLEIDLMSKSFMGGYSYNNTKFIKSLVNVEGSRLHYNAVYTANTSVFYTVSDQKLLTALIMALPLFILATDLLAVLPEPT